MRMNFVRKLPIPMDIKAQYPLKPELEEKKKVFDKEVEDIFTGVSDKRVLVIGPCSADNEVTNRGICHRRFRDFSCLHLFSCIHRSRTGRG